MSICATFSGPMAAALEWISKILPHGTSGKWIWPSPRFRRNLTGHPFPPTSEVCKLLLNAFLRTKAEYKRIRDAYLDEIWDTIKGEQPIRTTEAGLFLAASHQRRCRK